MKKPVLFLAVLLGGLYLFFGREEPDLFDDEEELEEEELVTFSKKKISRKPLSYQKVKSLPVKKSKPLASQDLERAKKIPPAQRQPLYEDFEGLYGVADSGREWLVSKRYSAVHCELHKGEKSRMKLGNYCVVEKRGGSLAVVYDKKTKRAGVVTGGIVLTLSPDEDVEEATAKFINQAHLSVMDTNIQLNTIFLKVSNPEDATTVARFLTTQGEYASVEMEVLQGGPYEK